jgi:hypothetical protein
MYDGVRKTQKQGGRSMQGIPETCAPVNARTVFEKNVDKAMQILCRMIGARLSALLVAILSHVVGRGNDGCDGVLR